MKSYFDFEVRTFWNHDISNLDPGVTECWEGYHLWVSPRKWTAMLVALDKKFVKKEKQQKSSFIEKENNSVATFWKVQICKVHTFFMERQPPYIKNRLWKKKILATDKLKEELKNANFPTLILQHKVIKWCFTFDVIRVR